MQNQQPTICLKIFHRLHPPYTSTLTLKNRTISQNLITKEINKFIGMHQLESFYDIEIKSQGNWTNIIDVLGCKKDNQFKVENINGQLTIQVRLVEQAESMQEEKMVRGMFKEWENRIKGIEGKSETIYRRIKEDARNIEEDYEIDLAIFYSDPLMNKNGCNEYQRDSVSFQTETRTIFQKLNNLLRQSNTIKHSANIVLEVGTRESIRKALSRGVKMLHFSCHGNLEELEIQSTDKIGICDDLTCQDIIEILKDYKLPEIIVFNACCSNQIAKLIHSKFLNDNKFVATFGFQGLVENQVCTQFATNFYSQIFKGNPIKESLNIALTEQVRQQLKSFFSQSQKITIKSTNIEQTKRLQIKNRLCNIPMRFQFPKQPLYIFLNYIHSNTKKIINLNGPMQIGKTLIAKKALFYLHQRNRIDQFHIVDLKEKGYQVCNVVDFKKEIKKSLIANFVDADKMLFVAIDHCDSLLKYQLHLFNKAIKEISVSQEPANRKILLISRTKVDEANYQIDFHSLDQSYKKRWCKISNLNIMQQVRKRRAQQSQTFVKNCYSYIFSCLKRLDKKFLFELPFINLFPDEYYANTGHNKKYESQLIKEQQLQQQCNKIIEDIENYSRSLTYCQEQIIQFQEQVQYWSDIVKEIYLILAIQMLIVHFADKFEAAKFQDVFKILNRVLNVCVIDQHIFMEKPVFAKLKESIKLVKIKVILLNFHIQKTWFVDEPYLSQISLSAIQESAFINYFGIQSKQFQEIYDLNKSLHNMSSQSTNNEQNNQQTSFQDIKNAGYLDIITHMSLKISQPNPKPQLKLYTQQQLDNLLLPLLPIIQRQIMSINKIKNENKINEIQKLIQKYSQMFNKDNIFSNVYYIYYENYVHVLYEREKYRLWRQKVVDRFEVIGKLNFLVEQCKVKNYAYLREEIENFKNNNFDFFVSFVSFPATKTYRLEINLAEVMQQTYRKLNKQVYLKLQTLSQENLQKYQKLKIKLPLVLYMVDVRHLIWSQTRYNQHKHLVQLCLQNNSREYDKDMRYIEVKKVNFLQSTISIICGNMSHKIRNEKLTKKSSVIIYIDTQKIHANRNEKYKSQIINEVTQKIQEVSHGLIIKQLIMKFYYYFCKFMFCNNQCFNNQRQQIQRAFLNAKLIAKIACAVKYGGFYHVISQLSDRISIQYTNDELSKMPPLQLNPSTQASNIDSHRIGNECKLKKHQQKPRNFYLDNIDTGSEIGYKQQSIELTKIIMTYFLDPLHKSNFLILTCKYHEEDTLINNIYGRLRRSQLFKIKFVRPNKANKVEGRGRERLNSMDSVSVMGQAVEGESKQQGGVGSTLFIVDLTGQKVESAQQKIEQRVHQQQRQVPQLTIFILNECPIFIQNENLKRIQKIMINKIENKNIIPLIIRKKMLLKMQEKDYSLKWTEQLISKMDKYLPLSKIQSIHSYDQDKTKTKINQRNHLEKDLEDLLK